MKILIQPSSDQVLQRIAFYRAEDSMMQMMLQSLNELGILRGIIESSAMNLSYNIEKSRMMQEKTNLINNIPAVSTNPPTAQETISLIGISLTHCWKSSTLNFSDSEEPIREAFQESAIDSRLAFPP